MVGHTAFSSRLLARNLVPQSHGLQHQGLAVHQQRDWRACSASTCRRDDSPEVQRFQHAESSINHVIPGHVLHVKVFGKGLGWIEIINVYQHAWGHQTTQSTIEAKRAAVWSKLRATLARVPRGSTLVLCGDLNTTLQKRLPYTGTGMLRKSQPSPDADSLEKLQSDFDCVAVNSFGRSTPTPTSTTVMRRPGAPLLTSSFFVGANIGSTRPPCCGTLRWAGGAKVGDIYLSGWTSRCGPTTPRRPPPAQLRHGLHGSASCWHRPSGMRRRSRSSFGRRWRPRWKMSEPISLVCSIRCCSMLVRRSSRSSGPAVYQLRPRNPAHVGTIRQMWEHYRGMRQLSPATSRTEPCFATLSRHGGTGSSFIGCISSCRSIADTCVGSGWKRSSQKHRPTREPGALQPSLTYCAACPQTTSQESATAHPTASCSPRRRKRRSCLTIGRRQRASMVIVSPLVRYMILFSTTSPATRSPRLFGNSRRGNQPPSTVPHMHSGTWLPQTSQTS